MHGSGEEQRETIRPEFNPAIMIDFQGGKTTSDTGFLLLRERTSVSGSWVQSGVNWRIPDRGFTANTLTSKWSGRGSIRGDK
jgi:hypothetical protein